MPITYQIDLNQRLIDGRVKGDVSVADLRAFISDLFEHPAFGTDLRCLMQLEGLTPRFTSSDLVQYHEWRRQKPPIGKMAIVATTDLEYGTARQFELATDSVGGSEFRVFKRLEDAREWLGVSDPKAK